ncbi:cytochrome b [Shewanella phaeophyticola]|uniref:Cytochrome b/b6 domain-containing protein n=1 Tax=Shewanella phaeophyticola TaxID=2978345 RepID=A0ABT2P113_9GAMM|nr:cytochrome b/b6 domain-containing protein [Shewanella sp. KJ10-1]MCT8986339.1 cytochrome b/b6 domain-containing protein [Shewanella sp. KJ10-1]
MSIKNTADNYGTIAKWLHVATAALFLGAYGSFYYSHWFTEPKTPESFSALQIHLSIGATIAVVVFLRILWRLTNPVPNNEPGSALAHLAAHVGHYALYAVMIIMPITGYMGTGGDINYFFLFDIPKFESTYLFDLLVNNGLGLTFKEFEKPMDFIHKDLLGAWVLWLLIL